MADHAGPGACGTCLRRLLLISDPRAIEGLAWIRPAGIETEVRLSGDTKMGSAMSYESGLLVGYLIGILGAVLLAAWAIWSKRKENGDNKHSSRS